MSRGALLFVALFGLLFFVAGSDGLRTKQSQERSLKGADDIRKKIAEAKAKHGARAVEKYADAVERAEAKSGGASKLRGRSVPARG